MLSSKVVLLFAAIGLSGCNTMNLPSRLGTMKNPVPILEGHDRKNASTRYPFMQSNFEVLKRAISEKSSEPGLVPYDDTNSKPVPMMDYLNAGFALSDMYCDEFFRDADESQRRRKFGRAITNDVGTVVSTVLGLANSGEDLVTGVAAGFGFGDSLWRNYDDAFVVAPDLSNVRELVKAAQDLFRKRTFDELPKDYGAAQSTIMRYADQCSTLGMKSLLNQSTNQQQQMLKEKAVESTEGDNVNRSSQIEQKLDSAPIAVPVSGGG